MLHGEFLYTSHTAQAVACRCMLAAPIGELHHNRAGAHVEIAALLIAAGADTAR